MAAGIATIISLVGTPLLIKLLARRGYAQAIRVSVEGELYPAHEGKRGTPSMGGAAIILAVIAGYGLTHLLAWRPMTPSGLLVIFLMVGLGLVGSEREPLGVRLRLVSGQRLGVSVGLSDASRYHEGL
jgi:phospho-N-acetylmuramoyl-pentapeptide-transferase